MDWVGDDVLAIDLPKHPEIAERRPSAYGVKVRLRFHDDEPFR